MLGGRLVLDLVVRGGVPKLQGHQQHCRQSATEVQRAAIGWDDSTPQDSPHSPSRVHACCAPPRTAVCVPEDGSGGSAGRTLCDHQLPQDPSSLEVHAAAGWLHPLPPSTQRHPDLSIFLLSLSFSHTCCRGGRVHRPFPPLRAHNSVGEISGVSQPSHRGARQTSPPASATPHFLCREARALVIGSAATTCRPGI